MNPAASWKTVSHKAITTYPPLDLDLDTFLINRVGTAEAFSYQHRTDYTTLPLPFSLHPITCMECCPTYYFSQEDTESTWLAKEKQELCTPDG